MRKWFWCCTAAGVAAAGFFGTMMYCDHNPDSAVTRAVTAACEFGLRSTPFSILNNSAATEETLTNSAPANRGATEEQNVVQVDLPGNELGTPDIQIRSDDELKQAEEVILPPVEIIGSGIGSVTGGEWQGQLDTVVVSNKSMPYAEDCCDDEHGQTGCFLSAMWNYMAGGLSGEYHAAVVQVRKMEYAQEDCVPGEGCPSLWRRFVQAIKGEKVELGATEEAEPVEPMKEEVPEYTPSPYHHHDLSCPRYNYPYNGQQYSPRPIPVEQQKVEPMKDSSEEREMPPAEKVGKSVSESRFFDILESLPSVPHIDTLEFRPSDRKLFDYAQGPGTL